MSRLNQKFRLLDGRVLGYDEHGAPDGAPVLYFHGTPSSRLEWKLFGSDALAKALRLRIIVPDRPGMGISTYAARRRISDWAEDVAALADHLGLDRFSILGYSGGGPYAVACALAIPERLIRVGVVSGAGPFDQPGLVDGIPAGNLKYFDLCRDKPWLSRLTLIMMGLMARVAGKTVVSNALAALPEPDRRVVSHPEMQAGFLGMLREALRQGPRGAQHDTLLMISPWDFRPEEISMHVEFWHGEEDCNAPPAMGRYVAGQIPDSRIHFFPGEGHISLMAGRIEEFLRYLLAGPDQ